jgi:hypothetical protein
MVKIAISELNPAGSELFSESESLVNSMAEMSEAELSATKGGGSKSRRGFFFGGFPGGFGNFGFSGFPGNFGGGFPGNFGGGFGGTVINNNNNNNRGFGGFGKRFY